ncbi:MAG: cadherin-like beta sandwich domain-containing protein [Spirochaetales bacterium]|nr:cadherin-like beta sandwich domain-containing protein [Spirochaetales bacterium]
MCIRNTKKIGFILIAFLSFLLFSCNINLPTFPKEHIDASLSAITITAGGAPQTLEPTFNPNTTEYRVRVPLGTTSIVFTGVTSSRVAEFDEDNFIGFAADGTTRLTLTQNENTVQVDGLQRGNNTLSVKIVAEDGRTEITYQLTIVVTPSQLALRWNDDQAAVTEEDTVNGRAITFRLENVDLATAGITVNVPLIIADPDNQIETSATTFLTFSSGDPTPVLTITGEADDDGNTDNEMATISFGTPSITGTNATNYTFPAPTSSIQITVVDDDAITVIPSLSSTSITEGGTTTLSFTLQNPDTRTVTITPTATGLTFAPATIDLDSTTSTGTITVTSTENTTDEPDQNINIALASSVSEISVAPSSLTLTVEDNDLPTPTGLRAGEGDAEVVLSWNRVQGASEYQIYRASGGNPAARLTTTPAVITTTTYTDTTVTNGTTYTYTVRALSSTESSDDSTSITATPAAPPPATTLGLAWTDDGAAVTEEDTTNGRTITFNLTGADLTTAGISVTIPVTITDAGNQIGSGSVTSLNFSAATPTPSITLTGRATDDGNTVNEQVSITFGTPTVTGANAANYTFPAPTQTIQFNVMDDDATAVGASLSPVTVREGGTSTLTLTLQNPDARIVTITPTATGVTFAPATVDLDSTTSSATITVTTTDDSNDEADNNVAIALASSIPAITVVPTSVTLTVEDDDLPVPTGVTAVAGNQQITLSWSSVTGATEYQIYRASGGNPAARVTTTPATLTSTTYIDTGLTNGTAYTYTVRAISATESSVDSATASATPAPPAATAITLSFTDDGATVTEQDTTNGRTITFQLNNVNLATANISVNLPVTITDAGNQIGGGTVTSLSFSSATPTPSITLTGRATDDGNSVNEQVTIGFGTPTLTGTDAALYSFAAPTQTIQFNVMDDDVTAVGASLSPVTVIEGGTSTLTLTLQNPDTRTVTITPTATGVTFAPATVDLDSTTSTATITVTATDNTTDEANRNVSIALASSIPAITVVPTSVSLTVEDDDLSAPSGVTAVAGNQQVTLSWSSVAAATEYRLYRASGGNPAARVTTTPATLTGTTYTDSSLTNGTAYTYTVRAFNTSESSVDSASASATPAAPALTTVGLSFTDDGATITEQDTTNGRTITFSLTGVDLSTANINVSLPVTITDTGNQIGGGSVTSLSFSSATPTPSITLTGRATDDGNTVNEQISIAFGTPNITGTGAALYTFPRPTQTIQFNVVDDERPTVTATMSPATITEGNASTLTLTFQNPGAQSVTITPSGTGVTFSPSTVTLDSTTTSEIINVVATQNTIDEANRNTTISLASSVPAIDISPASFPLTIEDDDLSVPTGFTASASNQQVDLSWNAVTGATEYRIYRAVAGGTPARLTTTPATLTATSYTDSGLTNGTTYSYSVRAFNSTESSAGATPMHATPVAPGVTIIGLTTSDDSRAVTEQDTLNGRTFGFSLSSVDLSTANISVSLPVTITDIGNQIGGGTVSTLTFNSATPSPSITLTGRSTDDGNSIDEQITIEFGAPTITGTDAALYAFPLPTQTIQFNVDDDDDPTVTATVSNNNIFEGYTTTLTLNLTNPSNQAIQVTPAVNGLSFSPATVTLDSGRTSRNITVTATDNNVQDGTRTPIVMFTVIPNSISVTPVAILVRDDDGNAPTNFQVFNGEGQVSLSWNRFSGATSYQIYRSNGGNPASQLTTTPATLTETSYIDTTVTNGVAYTYTVRAVTATITTPDSTSMTVTPGDYGNTRGTATMVGLGSIDGMIDNNGSDEDYFRIDLDAGRTFIARTTGSLDTRGTLYNASGTILTSGDNTGGTLNRNFQFVYEVPTTGTYYIRVGSFATATGAYTLELSTSTAADHSNNFANANRITLNEVTDAIISSSTDVDYFVYTTTGTNWDNFYIRTLGDLDTVGTLYDSDFNVIRTADNIGNSNQNFIFTTSPNNATVTYYLKVEGKDGRTGTYSVRLTMTGR